MNALFHVFIRELKIILTTKSYFMILLVLPPLLFVLYIYIYNEQALHNIPIAVWDEDHTEVSRLLTKQYDSSPYVKIAATVSSEEDVKTKMQLNEIQGVVHIPSGFQSAVQSNKPANITFYRNASNIIYAGLLKKVFAEVTLTINGGIVLERLKKMGVGSKQAKDLANPIKLHVHSMYNSTYNYQNYLVPGLMTVAFQMMIIMVTVLALNSEFENNTILELIKVSEGSALLIVIGKGCAFYLTSMVTVVLMFGVLFQIYNIPFQPVYFPLFILFSLFIWACIGIGFMVSALAKEALVASDLALFYTSPAFVFSGFTFPGWAMPWYDQFYAQLMPYSSFLMGFIHTYQMNSGWESIQGYLLTLITFITVSMSIAWAALKIQIKPLRA